MHILFLRVINWTLEIIKKARLINPTKTDRGLVFKNILQRIVSKILNKLSHILWKNLLDTIEWFKNIKHKYKTTFIQSDIIDFYPL